jgi:hypothetical protein
VETQQLLYAKVVFNARFSELYGTAFQDFFQKLMCYRYPTFLDVRTHGNIGDLSADGLCLFQGKLYACYGPQSPSETETKKKFNSDLTGALAKRSGEFTIFVFVHNDRIGIHPKVASEIALAQVRLPALSFEQMGKFRLWQEVMRLEKLEAEDVLGHEIRIEPLVYSISLVDLEPLLTHLSRTRDTEGWSQPHVVNQGKLEFNRLSSDAQQYLIHGMRFARQVDDYYANYYDVNARDEAAVAFRERYNELKVADLAPDDIFHELLIYVVGNRLPDAYLLTSAYTVLSYFFQTCDIFDSAPDELSDGATEHSS